jgi:amino acid adenylation domain-containing protein/thioester reductase-like protein
MILNHPPSPSDPLNRAIHHLIEEQTVESLDSIAIEFESSHLTYGQLNDRANQLAHHLQYLGVRPGVLVSICVERSLEMFVALLGVLKSGGTYIPLDPAYPKDRLEFMMEDSRSSVLITQGDLDIQLDTSIDLKRVYLDRDAETIAQYSQTNLTQKLTAEDLAYIIYTSGSTGQPKGVQIKHSALVNLLQSMQCEPGIDKTDTLLALTTISFDLAVPDLYLPLIAGAKIHLISRAIATDPAQLQAVLSDPKITFVQATPTTWRMVLAVGWKGNPSLKILCGGEALNRTLADQLLDRVSSLWNMYGPTETTVWSMVCQIAPDQDTVHLGHPIANTQIYLIDPKSHRQDESLSLVPAGVTGEICIGGAGVARGYLNRAELNQEKFIADVFHGGSGAKLYRTGDLARYLPNGEMEMIGRADSQVKVRGHRIELGEIEAILSAHPDIQEGAVIAPEDSLTGARRLAAYIVPKSHTDLTTLKLQRWLKEKLPRHMLPSSVMFMEAMPLTPNRKIDRRALPAPIMDLQEEMIAPSTVLEAQLVQLWSGVLGIEVGISQNFYEYGGDSLRTALLINRLQECFNLQVPLECLFKAPTVQAFAPLLQKLQTCGAAAEFQLTPQQLLAEAELPGDIYPTTAPKHNRHRLFLTGATGFIGAFLLQELLIKQPQATIYCLVRAKTIGEASDRLRSVMKGYEIWSDAFGERIIPVLGDLEKPQFGMGSQQFLKLANQIDVIYHSGAYVNLVYPYSALRDANVGGTVEVLRLATINQTIPLHYISTIDVFHSAQYNGCDPILESDQLPSADGYYEGYAQTKWVAEKLVMAAIDRGLPTVIYRLGMITGHSKTGGSQLGNLICRMIKGFIQMGTAPDLEMGMVLAPVDYVVEAIAALSYNPSVIGQSLHIVSPHRLSFKQFVADINSNGHPVEIVSYTNWHRQLKHVSDNALIPIASMFAYDDRHGGSAIETGTFVAQTHDTMETNHHLSGTNIECPSLTQTTIQAYIQYFNRQGFLPCPTVSAPAIV